jgi:hypothetical protein
MKYPGLRAVVKDEDIFLSSPIVPRCPADKKNTRRARRFPRAFDAAILQAEEKEMDGIGYGNVRELVGLAVQKSALDIQAGMVSKLLEGADAGMRQDGGQIGAGLRMDALGERGIGANLNIVA